MNTAVSQTENLNPFAHAPIVARPASDAMVAVSSAREVAEVQASMTVARRFPRAEVEVMDKILQACTRPTLASAALYEYNRGGNDIRGPSIRLMECIAQYWGHLDFGWRVLEERPGATKVQCFAWDLQSGVRSQVTFDVTHERKARDKITILSDPRDIYEHVANAASRRLRACLERVIPDDVVEAAVKQCERTLHTKAEVTPERLQNLVTQFGEYGVTRAAVEKRIGRRLDSITPGLMIQLGKIYTSLRDGMSVPGDWFDMGTHQPAADTPPAGTGGAGEVPSATVRQTGRDAVRERLAARRRQQQAPAGEPELYPHAHPEAEPAPAPAGASAALQDIIKFAKAAQDDDAIEQVRQIALTLDTEQEALIAQQHINAAVARLAV